MTGRLLALGQLARPYQWTKNGVVLAALVFSNNLLNGPLLSRALLAMAAFCLASSATYAFNDLVDRSSDLQHPLKRFRPVASGRVSPAGAVLWSFSLLAGGILLALPLGAAFLLSLGAYLLLQVLYTLALKRQVLLDVFSIALGFVVRAVAGAQAISVAISPWLVLCALLLALFLGFSKRRHELVLLGDGADVHRTILAEYSVPLLDQLISVVTAATIVAYSVYTLSPEVTARLGTRGLILTVPFVIYGIFRYLYLVHRREEGGNPSRTLFNDVPLLMSILLWGVTAVLAIRLHL